jgi:hypothetical protein
MIHNPIQPMITIFMSKTLNITTRYKVSEHGTSCVSCTISTNVSDLNIKWKASVGKFLWSIHNVIIGIAVCNVDHGEKICCSYIMLVFYDSQLLIVIAL